MNKAWSQGFWKEVRPPFQEEQESHGNQHRAERADGQGPEPPTQQWEATAGFARHLLNKIFDILAKAKISNFKKVLAWLNFCIFWMYSEHGLWPTIPNITSEGQIYLQAENGIYKLNAQSLSPYKEQFWKPQWEWQHLPTPSPSCETTAQTGSETCCLQMQMIQDHPLLFPPVFGCFSSAFSSSKTEVSQGRGLFCKIAFLVDWARPFLLTTLVPKKDPIRHPRRWKACWKLPQPRS